ncbi:MAG: GNAT family N-acetyltransferase [Deltaproteobacteria bacterium]|nr:GNAT family N-acetyltransferase [Deltaproteobacteria bacterium]
MIFEPLWASAQKDELILTLGGLCHFHKRKDGQVTIHEIIVLPKYQRQSKATTMLNIVKARARANPGPQPTSIFAKVPADLPANLWFKAMGFQPEGNEETKSGRIMTLWRLKLTVEKGRKYGKKKISY